MPYFECLHCGTVTPIEATPPKCPRCGHGTGVIHQKEYPGAGKPDDLKNKEPDKSARGLDTA